MSARIIVCVHVGGCDDSGRIVGKPSLRPIDFGVAAILPSTCGNWQMAAQALRKFSRIGSSKYQEAHQKVSQHQASLPSNKNRDCRRQERDLQD